MEQPPWPLVPLASVLASVQDASKGLPCHSGGLEDLPRKTLALASVQGAAEEPPCHSGDLEDLPQKTLVLPSLLDASEQLASHADAQDILEALLQRMDAWVPEEPPRLWRLAWEEAAQAWEQTTCRRWDS